MVKASLIMLLGLAWSVSTSILAVRASISLLQYPPRLNWPAPALVSRQATRLVSALAASIELGVQPSRYMLVLLPACSSTLAKYLDLVCDSRSILMPIRASMLATAWHTFSSFT